MVEDGNMRRVSSSGKKPTRNRRRTRGRRQYDSAAGAVPRGADHKRNVNGVSSPPAGRGSDTAQPPAEAPPERPPDRLLAGESEPEQSPGPEQPLEEQPLEAEQPLEDDTDEPVETTEPLTIDSGSERPPEAVDTDQPPTVDVEPEQPPVAVGTGRHELVVLPEGDDSPLSGPPAGADFTVLVVCRANLFRSPLIEHLLRARLVARGVRWHIESAGTHAVAGDRMDPHVAAVLAKENISVEGWKAQVADADLLTQFDLVLASDLAVRAELVSRAPAMLASTFAVRQFTRLLTAAQQPAAGEPRDWLACIREARGRVQPASDVSDDIADPAGRGWRARRTCVRSVYEAVDKIADQTARLTDTTTAARTAG